mmetsp:Transcript_60257/g.191436  ORF Transcript_60257/g.191436 Transcript_60257/m.191436 type:complete len:258 (-) Transcript_60257:1803-2576(-)
MAPTSACSIISSSIISQVEDAPRGRARAKAQRYRVWKPEVELTGSAARRRALSIVFWRSRCPTKVMPASLPNTTRMRCTRVSSGCTWPSKVGMGGTSATTFSPNSSPHTPHSEHTSWEQSGTVAASSAFWRSAFSHHFAMPVSTWSHGRGASSRSSAMSPRSMRPLPPPPCLRYRASPIDSITSQLPPATWRYFQSTPASAIALSHRSKEAAMSSHHPSLVAPSSYARLMTPEMLRSPLPMKSSMALRRTGVKLYLH